MSRTQAAHVGRRSRWLAVFTAALLAGCTEVPAAYRVDLGDQPSHRDQAVRFRTVYYFRVFDVCKGTDGKDAVLPQTDSIYRFTMTGKAPAYVNKVHFEAGTLKSWQIDPFGSTVDFDQTSGRFYYKSQRQTEQEVRQGQAIKEIDNLVQLKNKKGLEGASETIDALIKQTLGDLRVDGGLGGDKTAKSPSIDDAKTAENKASEATGTVHGGAPAAKPGEDALDNLAAAKSSVDTSISNAAKNAKQRAQEAQASAAAAETAANKAKTDADTAQQAAQADLDRLKVLLEAKKTDATRLANDLNAQNTLLIDAAAARQKAVDKYDSATTTDPVEKAQIEIDRTKAMSTYDVMFEKKTSLEIQKKAAEDDQKNLETNLIPKAETALKDATTLAGAAKIAADTATQRKGAVDKAAGESIAAADKVINGTSGNDAGAGKKDKKADSGGGCSPNSALRRGFQVLGPEGVRTFNQDDRLILAMSSSADPLIGAMQEISSRILDRRASQSEQLLPYAKERLAIVSAQRSLDSAGSVTDDAGKTDPSTALGAVISAFAAGEGAP